MALSKIQTGFVPTLVTGDLPSGTVIKTQSFDNQGNYILTNATTEVDILSVNYTPVLTGSTIVISGMCPCYHNNTNTGVWSPARYLWMTIDSTVVANYEHPGPQNSVGEMADCIPFHYTYTGGTAGTQLTIKLRHQTVAGTNNSFYFGRPNKGSGNGGANASLTRGTITEIQS